MKHAIAFKPGYQKSLAISEKGSSFGVEQSSFLWFQYFSTEDDAIISENCIASDNLPMHVINILIPDHQPPTGP